MEDLSLIVTALVEAEDKAQSARELITKWLVENERHEYFKVDWQKLKRDHGHSDSFGRRSSRKKERIA